jgi:hypothetical protein
MLTVQSIGKVEETSHKFVVICKQSSGCSLKQVGILKLLFKEIELSFSGRSPYTSTDKTNNKYT